MLPSSLHYRSLQIQQTRRLQETESYETQITLTSERWEELIWWVRNLKLNEGKAILTLYLIIKSDTEKTEGWGTHCQELKTKSLFEKDEKNLHINTLELKVAKLEVMTFTRLKAEKAPHTDGKHSSTDVHTKNRKEKEAKGKILKYIARSYLEL